MRSDQSRLTRPPSTPTNGPAWPGLVVAALLVAAGLATIAWYPRQPAGTGPEAVNSRPLPPDQQRWGAMYRELTRPVVSIQAPAVLDDGSRLSSLSVWRPGWFGTGTVWHWLFESPAGQWLLVVVDPTVRHKVGSDEVKNLASLEAVRIVEGGGGLTTLEWDLPGYAMTIHAAGVPEDELAAVAAGIIPGEEPSMVTSQAPVITSIPEGMTLLIQTRGEAGTAGPGTSGWRATYFVAGGEQGTVTITAATERALPFVHLFRSAGEIQSGVRGGPALAFDYPDASTISLTSTRAHLIWMEDDVMVEAVSNRLPLSELAALVESLELSGDAGN